MEKHRVRAYNVAWIVWKIVPAVINNCFKGPNRSEECRLAVVQPGNRKAVWEADPVNRYGLQRMVVESTISEGYVDVVVHGMNMFC